jgi:hypothetical protein
MDSAQVIPAPCDLSQGQQQIVRDTLRSILESPHFSKSKRYPALLEYLVLYSLEGGPSLLKERTVGIDVFGRSHTYDPSIDPVVRVAAGEVRKRVALYFSEHPEAPVRIDLPLGHYAAEFHFRPASTHESVLAQPRIEIAEQPGEAPPDEPVQIAPGRTPRLIWGAALAASLLLLAGGAAYFRYAHNPARLSFWEPVLRNEVPAVVVVGELAQSTDPQKWAPPSSTSGTTGTLAGTSMANAITAGQICNIFRGYGRSCEMVSATRAGLPDLQNKTIVLIGLDNDWTHRLLVPLRYRFQSQAPVPTTPNTESIVDQSGTANHPAWKISPNPQTDTDYALVARFHSDITDGYAVVAAGLTPNGTLGAEQFLSTPENMAQISAQAPKDWKGFNFEAVLQINVLQDAPGHVKVVATQFW